MLKKTSFDIESSDLRRANLASAAAGLSTAELFRCFIRAGLQSMAEHEQSLSTAFELLCGDQPQVKVPA
jgi:hypothetical protein